ncbi:hypothetical protein SPRG_05615 [Saprolegnia parasitica CBS 223.65]|uniref:Amino acid permease/ SLC12A domain-containing protein n=1 Tax=Saprolegnia parasitica (strain CBS 223.65) TaxID=695850 RepID=A0A067CGP7_SAPPC|nr:hypothetical protein SPRG_05615 [Saprolegnia parasitica CBS 223.65]KDO29663.1 hypothetical protein SPRG_05615 [Saprolegnia parasitica CBS 223.65]|eukprot:XP_012199721.1 hypothetical protein SPRG_05615 [Saprolegnia parasitica CBS 223.65]
MTHPPSQRRVVPVASESNLRGLAQQKDVQKWKLDDCIEPVILPADKASTIHVWALGFVCVIGGHLYGWNEALQTGFLPFALSQIVTGAAYVVYVTSIAEVSCKVPFAGVSYSLTRITLGFFCGFVVGFVELLEYVASAACSVGYVADFVTAAFAWDDHWKPLIWFVFYAVSIAVFQLPGRIYWRLMVLFAFVCAIPMLLVVVAGCMYGDLAQNGAYRDDPLAPVWATGTITTAYFAWLPYTTWGYAGVESLTLIAGDTKEPKRTLPRGMLCAVVTLFCSNMSMVFVVPSLPPGIASAVNATFPLNNGLGMLGISETVGQWLILPAQMGMAAGFFLQYAHLTQSLANSNMLPACLGLKNQATTLKPMVAASAFGYLLCTLSHLSPAFEKALQNLFLLAATFCYSAQLIGFGMLRTTYRCDSKEFTSPFGIPGAVFAGSVYLLLALSIAGGFQGDDGVAVASFAAFLLLLLIYYHTVCKSTQTLTKDEYAAVFKFSVIKYNAARFSKSRSHRRSPITKTIAWAAGLVGESKATMVKCPEAKTITVKTQRSLAQLAPHDATGNSQRVDRCLGCVK